MPRRNKNGGRNQKRTPSHQRKSKKTSSNSEKDTKKKAKVGPQKKSSRSRTKKSGRDKNSETRHEKLHSKAPRSASPDPYQIIGKKVSGKVQLHADGFAFLLADDLKLPNIYIAKGDTGELLNHDLVEIVVSDVFGDSKYSGKVLQILKRNKKEIFGLLRKHAGGALVVPEDLKERRLSFNVEGSIPAGIKSGSLVLAEIIEYPSKVPGKVRVLKDISEPDAPHHDTLKVLVQGGWPRQFSAQSLSEAQEASDTWKERWDTRKNRNLREKNFVTIDGRDARDFDDAVYAEQQGDVFRLWVAIADVSNFVKTGTKLDEEAFEHSTSVYFPDFVVPMLPEVLSNNSCSLVPNEDRASMVCEMQINKDGRIIAYEFYGALIKSHRRMIYEEMQGLIEDSSWIKHELDPELENSLHALITVFHKLHQAKKKRGAIDMDIPEAAISLNEDGTVRDIQARSRLDAHRLIEECMLAANECASRFLFRDGQEGMFRIHEEPDRKKREELVKYVQLLGLNINFFPEKPEDFSKLLDLIKKSPRIDAAKEKSLQYMVLRTMQQARYSEERRGHFALALKDYTHFTSPIRRYPDLIVHRLIKEKLGINKDKKIAPSHLASMAAHCSDQERRAVDMERKLYDLKKCRFMERHIGKEFYAFVSNVIEKGAFCQIEEFFVDGLVSSETLKRRAMAQYDEKSMCYRGPQNVRIEIGTRLKIQVARVDVSTAKIDFELISLDPQNNSSEEASRSEL